MGSSRRISTIENIGEELQGKHSPSSGVSKQTSLAKKKTPRALKTQGNDQASETSSISSGGAVFAETKAKFDINFPKPTLVSEILGQTSGKLGLVFILEPSLDRKVQIFSSQKVSGEEAFKIIAASFGAVGLRLIFVDERTLKIAEKASLSTRV